MVSIAKQRRQSIILLEQVGDSLLPPQLRYITSSILARQTVSIWIDSRSVHNRVTWSYKHPHEVLEENHELMVFSVKNGRKYVGTYTVWTAPSSVCVRFEELSGSSGVLAMADRPEAAFVVHAVANSTWERLAPRIHATHIAETVRFNL